MIELINVVIIQVQENKSIKHELLIKMYFSTYLNEFYGKTYSYFIQPNLLFRVGLKQIILVSLIDVSCRHLINSIYHMNLFGSKLNYITSQVLKSFVVHGPSKQK